MAKKKTKIEDADAYSRGRVARKRGMDRNAVTPGSDEKSWQQGWDYQDGISNAED